MSLQFGDVFVYVLKRSDGYGQGRGGVGQIYQVQSSSNSSSTSSCSKIQTRLGSSDWPDGLQVVTVPATTTAWAALPTNTTSATETGDRVATATTSTLASQGSSLGTGAIVGIAAGAAAGAAAVAAMLFFLWRRRQKRKSARELVANMDLVDEHDHAANIEPKVEPYRPIGDQGHVPSVYGGGGYQSAQMVPPSQPWQGDSVDSPRTSTTFLPAGAGLSDAASLQASNFVSSQSPSGAPLLAQSNLPTNTSSTSQGSSQQGYFPTTSPSGVSPSADAKSPRSTQGTHTMRPPSPEIRRHTDGGELPSPEEPAQSPLEYVDLPPLYTDVPQRRA